MIEGTAVLTARDRVVRVRTLLLLRWLAILGQLTAILFVGVFLDFDMPLAACLGLVALSAWSNVFLRVKFADNRRMTEGWTAGVMAFDIAQLAFQLGLTGGLTNPFALLLIAPVMVSATTLSASRTFTLGALVLLSATMLVVAHEPLPWYSGEHYSPPFLFIGGIWLSLVCSLIFMGSYAFRVSEENRQLADALGATEIILQREQNLHALDGLAAAAAHELGTPLATILLVAKEMERELDPESPLAEDVALLRSQTERCRQILGQLKNLGEDSDSPLVRLNVRTLIEEVAEPHRGVGVEIDVVLQGDMGDQPVVARNPAIHYGLGNLIENAVDFAETLVRITATWSEERLTIVISDDGPGFADDVLDRIGDPYVSRRGEDQRGGGMGLGIFIAKTLLERTGATVTFEARGGATVTVTWLRRTLRAMLPERH
ncbi:ActS/PrrB/RegB family redox-sensitive histidine kinase [Acuticoccus sp. I52.16.1]|uniref:ActS/PrrB/RegB family redox-sensitive histidine kinase n=1 Tax=Acuticoccus sp. I52.16.1 TaxID=2928472 RepID=UPI001FD368AC|nr:ActS/PrrB/RegB family redox-sensitive histidine kinase [Acuticoccus sp. I52.16.1]UOM36373.1 ActS/PrrB/RegB family redox-sensitive histidine kinase [Acuticoccus sp. I52.16.1]